MYFLQHVTNYFPHIKGQKLTDCGIFTDELLKEANRRRITRDQTAYIIATVNHETGSRFRPIREWSRGIGRKYGRKDTETGHRYYGRGYVQLTWKDNYKRMGDRLGLNLVENPDIALDRYAAIHILIEGMMRGMFTGKRLTDYFNRYNRDPINARRIINGLDKAEKIANEFKLFKIAMQLGRL